MSCKKEIFWYDNIPVFSFLFLGGKCRNCKERISIQYPLIEAFTMMIFGSLFIFDFGNSLALARDLLFVSVLIIIFIYDLRWYLIPDKITIPAIFLLFLFNLALGYRWQDILISGIIGGGFFLLQFIFSKGRWIGGGDIRLGALMGVTLCWPGIAVALFLAYILGSVVGVGLIIFGGKKMSSQVPFGVFLSISSIVTIFYGDKILSWYLSFLV